MTEKQVDVELKEILCSGCDDMTQCDECYMGKNGKGIDKLVVLFKKKARECNPTKTELIEYVRSNLIEKVQELFEKNIDLKFK